jgi:hypothetical protein
MAKFPSKPSKPSEAAETGGTESAAGRGWTCPTATETARYIAEFSAELAALARQARLDDLACFLDMARLEAAHRAGSIDHS